MGLKDACSNNFMLLRKTVNSFMITQEKINEIRSSLRKGAPEGELKEQLQQQGYSKEDIDKIFTPHHYDMRSWYLGSAVLFGVVGLYLLLKDKGLLFLVFSGLMFFQYFRETERLKKRNN